MIKKFFFFYLILLCLPFSSCHKAEKLLAQREEITRQNGRDIEEYINSVYQQRNQAIVDFINSYSLEEKISQLFVVNISGGQTFVPVEENIAGGFLYFFYNIAETAQAMIDFNKSVNDYCLTYNKIPPFLTADQEGGYVARLSPLNAKLPSQTKLADTQNPELIQKIYQLQALQMKNLGFNMNLSPVAEVCTPDNESFLNRRSFGSLRNVKEYGSLCLHAYEDNGIATVVKHFPGNTNTDPHTGLPEINWSDEDFDMQMEAFQSLIKEKPTGILMSHARVRGHDQEVPACLSKYWVNDLIRKDFGYQGIIFSDDIFMEALAGNGYPPEKAVVIAIEAGIDCIMISEKRIGDCVNTLCQKYKSDSAFAARIEESIRRIIDYKLKSGILCLGLNQSGHYEVWINPSINKSFSLSAFEEAKKENDDLNRKYF